MHRFIKNETGYTFIESLMQFVLFVVFLQLFLLFFFWKVPIEKQYDLSATSTWEIFVLDMQNEIKEVQAMRQQNNREIMFETGRGFIQIEQYGQMIRKRVDRSGHIPLLMNIEQASFTIQGETVHIVVHFLNGTRKERDFAIGYRSE